ncbi:MAG: ATP-dependent Clp protease proteolytic subunit, partial [Clostridia bacterium]|nr:ATP-dependent Clp protease proteolytic subunit [Clostridia bacterium]
SIGVPLAVATNYSFIAKSATMTIHPVRMNGMIIGVPQVFDYFDKLQNRIVSFIAENSKIDKKDFNALMFETKEIANDVGTVLFGEEAVRHGIMDAVGTIHDALKKLHQMIG